MTNDQYQSAFALAMHLIKEFEGCRLTAYHGQGDPEGLYTIGYGMTTIYGRPVKPGETITQADADRMLGVAVAARMQAVDALVKPDLTDHQLAALTSFTYNEGVPAFSTSAMRRDINAGDFHAAGEEFDRWVYAHPNGKAVILAGLVHRRKAEEEVFDS